MATATRTQRRYDHGLRNLVCTTQDIRCAVQQGVPRSTAQANLRRWSCHMILGYADESTLTHFIEMDGTGYFGIVEHEGKLWFTCYETDDSACVLAKVAIPPRRCGNSVAKDRTLFTPG